MEQSDQSSDKMQLKDLRYDLAEYKLANDEMRKQKEEIMF